MVAAAALGQLVLKLLQVVEVGGAELRGVNHPVRAGLLQRFEARPVREGELQFVAIEDLEDENFVAGVAEVRESLQQFLRVAEAVGEHDEQAAPRDARDKVTEDVAQRGLAAGLGGLEFVQQHAQVRDAGARRDVAADFGVEGDEAHAVALLEHEVGERGGEPDGVVGLRRAARTRVAHGAAEVEQERGAEVGFLLVFADVVTVGLAEDLPVEPADFVALHILPVLGELDAEALVRRLVQPGEKALDHPLRDDLQVRYLLQLGRREEVGDVGHAIARSLSKG